VFIYSDLFKRREARKKKSTGNVASDREDAEKSIVPW